MSFAKFLDQQLYFQPKISEFPFYLCLNEIILLKVNGGNSLRKGQSILLFIPFVEIDPAQIKHFHDAAVQGDVNEAAALLEAGVPVDSSDEGGNTALMFAAMNNQIDLVHLLVQKRAELNKQGGAGWAPLHFAAQVNATDAIRILVQQGASTNIRTIDGHTPLDLAHRYSSKEAVILLEQR